MKNKTKISSVPIGKSINTDFDSFFDSMLPTLDGCYSYSRKLREIMTNGKSYMENYDNVTTTITAK